MDVEEPVQKLDTNAQVDNQVPVDFEPILDANDNDNTNVTANLNTNAVTSAAAVASASFPRGMIRVSETVKNAFSQVQTPHVEWSNTDRFYLYLCLKHFPLFSVMQEATKVLTTKDWILAREEMEAVKVMETIERMKEESRWSCRQRKKFSIPNRRRTRWDHILEEAVSRGYC